MLWTWRRSIWSSSGRSCATSRRAAAHAAARARWTLVQTLSGAGRPATAAAAESAAAVAAGGPPATHGSSASPPCLLGRRPTADRAVCVFMYKLQCMFDRQLTACLAGITFCSRSCLCMLGRRFTADTFIHQRVQLTSNAVECFGLAALIQLTMHDAVVLRMKCITNTRPCHASYKYSTVQLYACQGKYTFRDAVCNLQDDSRAANTLKAAGRGSSCIHPKSKFDISVLGVCSLLGKRELTAR